jgi:hypothetical protein
MSRKPKALYFIDGEVFRADIRWERPVDAKRHLTALRETGVLRTIQASPISPPPFGSLLARLVRWWRGS